ncbi:MAG: FAD-dependent oxidoreductase [Chloroflexota bacterium]
MTVSLWQAGEQQPTREVDFLVIGAGIVGCAAAYFAGQAGREVVITEMRDVALGASSRNAGFMITGLDTYYHTAIEHYGREKTRELWTLSEKTHAYWLGFAEQYNVPVDYCGSMLLAESPSEAKELVEAARLLDADGHATIFHERDPLERGYYAAIEQPLNCAVQPYLLTKAVLEASGAELIANNEVYAIEQNRPEVVTVRTRQYIFEARHVLICTNAYSARLHPYFVGKVIPTRGQIFVTAPLKEAVLNTCGYSDYGYMYYRMTFDNRLLIGGGRKLFKELEHDTTDDRVTDPVQRFLEAYLHEHFPDVDAPIDRRWAGIMGFSVDGLPQVGTLPGMPRAGFAVGFTGHGLAFGAGVAERAVDHLLTGADPGAVSAARLG